MEVRVCAQESLDRPEEWMEAYGNPHHLSPGEEPVLVDARQSSHGWATTVQFQQEEAFLEARRDRWCMESVILQR